MDQEEACFSSRYLPAVEMREAAVWHKSNAFKANGSEHFDELKFHVRGKIRMIHLFGLLLPPIWYTATTRTCVRLIKSANTQKKTGDLQGTVQKKYC